MSATTLPAQLSPAAREFASRRQRLLIDGEWVESADGRSFDTVDPATGRPITQVAHAGAEDVARAVAGGRAVGERPGGRAGAAAQPAGRPGGGPRRGAGPAGVA